MKGNQLGRERLACLIDLEPLWGRGRDLEGHKDYRDCGGREKGDEKEGTPGCSSNTDPDCSER